MTSKLMSLLGAATLIGGIASAPLAFAQSNPTPPPSTQSGQSTTPNNGMMGGQGMMNGQGIRDGSMGNMNGMMSMMDQMNRMMNICNNMMESMNSSHPTGGTNPGTEHSSG